jgi:hypothetical protein
MPNWCENRIRISGSTEKINKLWEKVESDGLLNTLRPQPNNLEEYENIDWRLQKKTGVQSGKLIHKTYVLRTMVTEPLTSMEILIAHGRHQSKRTLHSIR